MTGVVLQPLHYCIARTERRVKGAAGAAQPLALDAMRWLRYTDFQTASPTAVFCHALFRRVIFAIFFIQGLDIYYETSSLLETHLGITPPYPQKQTFAGMNLGNYEVTQAQQPWQSAQSSLTREVF